MEGKGFFVKLFDLSFSEFITTSVIRVLFILGIIASAIGTIAFIASGFVRSAGMGVLFLLLSPVIFVFYALCVRIWCEIIIVLFKIADNTTKIAEK